MSTGMPSLTILSEEQKFNGDNLLQWNTNITQLLASKGLLGYIDGKISKPAQITDPKADTAATAAGTPIYSSTPTLDISKTRVYIPMFSMVSACFQVAGNLQSRNQKTWLLFRVHSYSI
jgi:hypothetical protein